MESVCSRMEYHLGRSRRACGGIQRAQRAAAWPEVDCVGGLDPVDRSGNPGTISCFGMCPARRGASSGGIDGGIARCARARGTSGVGGGASIGRNVAERRREATRVHDRTGYTEASTRYSTCDGSAGSQCRHRTRLRGGALIGNQLSTVDHDGIVYKMTPVIGLPQLTGRITPRC